MRYLDSGNRNPSQALGTWLQQTIGADVAEVRFQSGFFAANGLGLLQEHLRRMASENRIVRALVGSNDQCTVRQDIDVLVALMGLPRSQAELGIVTYGEGYFHPKTFHVRREDGSQAAYVGSANLTESGVSSLHVEAGIAIDNRGGDSTAILDEIASAVDSWFRLEPEGLHRVVGPDDVERLTSEGILALSSPVRAPATTITSSGEIRTVRVTDRLRPLIRIPGIEGFAQGATGIGEAEILRIVLAATPRIGYPQYLLFAPGQNTPTEGRMALSGSSLPDGVSGLIIRLNRDTGRYFAGGTGTGTANISVPVATLGTIRFGLQATGYARPRAEFDLRVRYVASDSIISSALTQTNIMAYGMQPEDTGHGDVRMLVPRSVRGLSSAIRSARKPLPQLGHVALLEWPTMNEKSEFRFSLLEPGGELFWQTERLLDDALSSGRTVGAGACWLPLFMSPPWIVL